MQQPSSRIAARISRLNQWVMHKVVGKSDQAFYLLYMHCTGEWTSSTTAALQQTPSQPAHAMHHRRLKTTTSKRCIFTGHVSTDERCRNELLEGQLVYKQKSNGWIARTPWFVYRKWFSCVLRGLIYLNHPDTIKDEESKRRQINACIRLIVLLVRRYMLEEQQPSC